MMIYEALNQLDFFIILRHKSCIVALFFFNKAGYTATPVACGWAGAVIEVTRSFGQEQ